MDRWLARYICSEPACPEIISTNIFVDKTGLLLKPTNFPIGIQILLMANSPNLNSAYYQIFRNLSMIAHVIEISKLKFANI